MPSSIYQTTLRLASCIFGTIFTAFGVNAMLRPQHSLTFFPFAVPTAISSSPQSLALLEGLLVIYGARDIFMGVAIIVAAAYADKRALGWIMISGGAVAGVDGWVVKGFEGRFGGEGGQWGHWGYGPVLAVVGAALFL